MKERVVLFSDAVIAIILTIMVLELKVTFVDGSIDFFELARGIGIYFISFCFVANLWFQTAQSFNKVEDVKNKDLVIYLISLFFLSLVPMSTGLLIEDTTREVVLMYGLLTMIVTLLTQQLLVFLAVQTAKEAKNGQQLEVKLLKKRNNINLILRFFLLIIAYFFTTAGLVIYLILPIWGFLQNMIDREEHEFINQMDQEQADYYVADQQHFWGNPLRKYSKLLSAALNDSKEKGEHLSPEWWDDFNQDWQMQLDKQIDAIEDRMGAATSETEVRHLNNELARANIERDRIQRKVEFAKSSQERDERHQKRLERKTLKNQERETKNQYKAERQKIKLEKKKVQAEKEQQEEASKNAK